MNSRNLIMSFVSVLIFSCQVKTARQTEAAPPTLVDPKYSIAKDRTEFDQIRAEVPPDVKVKNDESALKADWMGELKHAPEVIREKMTVLSRKKRDLFNSDIVKKREAFNKDERKTREAFLKKIEDDRKNFTGAKADREKRADFFEELDERRKEYFSEQKDKREDFEADIREDRKDFEDYAKEKSDEFNADLKAYTIKWNAKIKAESPK